jgi:hypothetical protein
MSEMSWAVLQRVALDDAHPAWFGEMDAELVDQARRSTWGRRLLARSLARHAAPVLFGSLPAVVPQALSSNRWMLLPGDQLGALALDLGAFAYAAAVRTRVERMDVLRLRRVLGRQRYAQTLASVEAGTVSTLKMESALDTALASDGQLADVLYQRGLSEWIGFVAPMHPAAIERLRLCAAPGEVAAASDPWLAASRIATHLALAPDIHREAANDGMRGDH